MKITKKELKKISRKHRKIASDVMCAYYAHQNAYLKELINYIDQTPLLIDYINSQEFELDNLENDIKDIYRSPGTISLDLGSNGQKRVYLLYKAFVIMLEKDYETYMFGRYFTSSTKYQDLAEEFGNRLIYPFVSEIEEYIKDIMTDMGYDDNNSSYSIQINSAGVQVNIADNNSSLNANQKNVSASEEVMKKIDEIDHQIQQISEDIQKNDLKKNLDLVKSEISKPDGRKDKIPGILRGMYHTAAMVAMMPDLAQGISMLATMLGISL